MPDRDINKMDWAQGFDERQKKQILFSQIYADQFPLKDQRAWHYVKAQLAENHFKYLKACTALRKAKADYDATI